MADARHSKGLNLLQLVKMLRHDKDPAATASLSPEAREVLDSRVMMSSWYSFPVFTELLLRAHELLGGTDGVAVEMGRQGGAKAFGSVHQAYVRRRDPAYIAGIMPTVWQSFFDFGGLAVEQSGSRAVIAVSDYPDVSRCHAHVLIGWCIAGLEQGGAGNVRHRIEAAPWLGDSGLRFVLEWG